MPIDQRSSLPALVPDEVILSSEAPRQKVPDAAEIWLAFLRASGRSPATLKIYGHSVDRLRAWRSETGGDGRRLETLTRMEALAFVQYLLDRHQANGVRTRVKSLRAFFGWLVAEEFIAVNPFNRINISVPDKEQPVVDDDQITAMLARAKAGPNRHRDIALITLLRDTGCRKGELAAVEVDDVNLADGTIRFRVSKSKPRTVPLTDAAVVAVGRWLRQRPTVARPGMHNLWASDDSYSLITKVLDRASGSTVSAHQFRRRFATQWLSNGGSEIGLMRICGWSSRLMVGVYTKSHAHTLATDEMRRLMMGSRR